MYRNSQSDFHLPTRYLHTETALRGAVEEVVEAFHAEFKNVSIIRAWPVSSVG